MPDAPWLTIVGLGEDGPDGLPAASRAALDAAEVVMAPTRHLSLIPETGAERIAWPVPFAEGLPLLKELTGRRTVVLASGDPFWFGAGSVIAREFAPHEWRALPGPSTFSLAAARLGWPLDRTTCLGLHAAPLSRLRPHLAPGQNMIVLLRDGAAVALLADYLSGLGFGASTLHVMEALGGPREHVNTCRADGPQGTHGAPVCVAIEPAGGPALPQASGLPDDTFETDGTMTKRPVRALTLSALAPRPGEHLWDVGGGSGSVAVEWLLSHPTTQATTVEPREDRRALIARNAASLGQDRLRIVEGSAPGALEGLAPPDAVFVGGGLSQALLDRLTALPKGTRLVANAVTLDSEALLVAAQARLGGTLLRLDLSEAAPLGPRKAWKAAYPVVQWSVTL
ncbi:precorrin-6y C5,15-methyltransferase (decarboxylating) subunit CbiE [Allosediminivita pacifica]|uniref:Precorrin-6Y C5,15-methyltransferase (Decarboxylating) n=1 Tax=Allosediminivita pacifica TaxID=1267769 RepID=A0A2T6B7L9_9RHOB|nr:precorrin-6y C5,15-methyltransferase (decarboxylating) subunit CbiE [Allosediminivita pacifica]PTX52028.1 precorrin-6Y C5,15-methyltransferase (decarboxylating) [Allosediminivita pacifica]